MSEVEWNDDGEEVPRKKRGVPKWVWLGCGGGCLIAVVLAVVIGVLLFRGVQKMGDPEYVWPKVEKILPFDERPEGYTPKGGGLFGSETYVVEIADSSFELIVQRHPTAEQLDMHFDPDSIANRGVGGVGKLSEMEIGTIEIQGEETRCMRFLIWLPEAAKEEGEVNGASIRVDVTGEGALFGMIQIVAGRHEESVSDETVRELLEPFDVWRDK